jgi:hypothetical protein
MPVFFTQFRDGDFAITFGNDREEALAHLRTEACVDDIDIVELQERDHLTISFSLDEDSSLRIYDYAPLHEAYRICFPSVVKALCGNPIGCPSVDGAKAVKKAVQYETRLRPMSKLSRRLEDEAKGK